MYCILLAARTGPLAEGFLGLVPLEEEVPGEGSGHAADAHVPVVDHEEHHDEQTGAI